MNQEQIIQLKKFIKEENPGGQRLGSLRLPRDLTLGGTVAKPQKKFVPNLNVTRNKNKAKGVLKRNIGVPQKIDNKLIKSEPNTFRKRDAGRFVQSSGIFSDGLGAADIRKTGRWSDRRSDKENDGGGPSSMTMPSLKKKNWVIDKNAENSFLDDLMCNNDSEEVDEKLPFHPINWGTVTSKEIKTEEPFQPSSSSMLTTEPSLSKIKLGHSHYVSNEYLIGKYNDNCPATSLWKMPDSLCGQGFSDDPDCKEIFDYCLDNMLEGQIGKLVIRKSGKMEVHIGRGRYILEQSAVDPCREDILTLDPNSKKGVAATVLAGINNRFSLHADWDKLFK